MKPWYLYVVLCNDTSLYTGITTDIKRRVSQHNSGRGAKYTKGRGPVVLVHVRQYKNRSDASKAESKFKKLRRTKKLQIVQNIALPGEIVKRTDRSSRKQIKYGMVTNIKDYTYGNYLREGTIMYEMSDGTTGFSYFYERIDPWDFI